MDRPPLNAIRAFEAAARHLSVSAAGDELHVTHAAISHQLRRLEEWLGMPLLRRSGRGVALTPAGSELLGSASRALRDIDEACRMIRRRAKGQSVVVGCIPSIASRWLVPRLADFRSRFASVALKVVYAQAGDRLDDADVDVLITLGADFSPSVENRRLMSRINRPVCSPHYRTTNPEVESPDGILTAALLHDETHAGWREWFEAAGLRHADPSAGLVFADFNILATAVIAGHGVALCPVDVFRAEIGRGDLVVLSDVATNRDKAYYLTMRSTAPPEARDFADWFVAAIADAETSAS